MIRTIVLALMFLVCAASLHAQEISPELRDLIEQRIGALAEQLGDNSDVDLSGWVEQVLDHINNPIDINSSDPDELASLHLLTDIQINAIEDHIRRFGKFISIYELQTVDGLDPATLEMLRPFLTVHGQTRSRTSFKEMLANGSHEVLMRTEMDVQQRKGYMGQTNIFGTKYVDPDGDALPDFSDPTVMDSLRKNSKVYLGSPYKLYTRYRFRYRQNVDFGITAEKDQGEEFFKGSQTQGFDFYSAHLFLRDIGPLKSVALGDFQARFGQGLVFSSGLSYMRKSSYTMNIKSDANGLTPYTSVNENQFLRGAGATMEFGKHFEGTAFISHKQFDASVQTADTAAVGGNTNDEIFGSFLEDGYHRTASELAKKNALDEMVYGGNLRYRQARWSLGATFAQAQFGGTLQRSNGAPYNEFEFQGAQNTTYGFDWNVLYRNVTWFGEGARSGNGGMAGTTGLLVALDKRLSLALLYRDLQRNYLGLNSATFQEGSNPWNERGLYTGIEFRPDRHWVLNAFFDQFTFPWLRYSVNAPSDGYEVLGQLTWTPSKKVQLYIKARRQVKEINTADPFIGIAPLVPADQVNYRFNASYSVSPDVTLRTRVESVDYTQGNSKTEHGFLIYEDIIHRPKQGRLEFTGRVMLFSTDSYDARLYAFESDIPGVFSLPPIYGRGMMWYTMVRYSIGRHIDLWARYGITTFDDRDVISSGLQEIAGNKASELKMEMRLKF